MSLENLIKEFTRKLQAQAKADKTNASGDLAKSFTGKITKKGIEISSNVKYLGSVDKGLNPRGRGKIPKVENIQKWAKLKGIRPYRKLKSGGVKFSKITDNSMRSMAIGIAMGIKKNGTIKRFQYKGSNIFDKVLDSMQRRIGLEVGDGFSADLRSELRRIVKIKR